MLCSNKWQKPNTCRDFYHSLVSTSSYRPAFSPSINHKLLFYLHRLLILPSVVYYTIDSFVFYPFLPFFSRYFLLSLIPPFLLFCIPTFHYSSLLSYPHSFLPSSLFVSFIHSYYINSSQGNSHSFATSFLPYLFSFMNSLSSSSHPLAIPSIYCSIKTSIYPTIPQ